MSRSLDYRLRTPGRTFRFGPAESPVAADAAGTGMNVSFKFLLVFILILYSNIAQAYPALELFRPALTVGLGGIFIMVVELAIARRSFRLAWPESYLLLAFLGVCVISGFSALYLRSAFDTTTNFSKLLLLYALMENTITSERRVRTVMLTMVATGVIPALGMIKNYINGNLVEGSRAAWVGVFANPNEAAYVLVLLVPIAIMLMTDSGWFMRAALAGGLGVMLLAIYLSFSRGGLLGLVVVLGMLGWKQKFIVRVLMIGALGLGLIAATIFWTRKDTLEDIGQDTTVNQRIATIRAGIAMFEDKPLLGVGPGCSIVAYPLYVPAEAHCGCEEQLVIHNSFIQVLSELGIFGFITWMSLMGFALWHARQLQQRGPLKVAGTALELAMWGYLACSLSGGFTYSWFPYLVIALIVAAKRISDDQSREAIA